MKRLVAKRQRQRSINKYYMDSKRALDCNDSECIDSQPKWKQWHRTIMSTMRNLKSNQDPHQVFAELDCPSFEVN